MFGVTDSEAESQEGGAHPGRVLELLFVSMLADQPSSFVEVTSWVQLSNPLTASGDSDTTAPEAFVSHGCSAGLENT